VVICPGCPPPKKNPCRQEVQGENLMLFPFQCTTSEMAGLARMTAGNYTVELSVSFLSFYFMYTFRLR